MIGRGSALLGLLAILASFGCIAHRPHPIELVSGIDANNRRIPRIRCDVIYVSAIIRDAQGGLIPFLGDGILRYAKPRNLYFAISDGSVDIMRIGSSDERYWLWIKEGGKDLLWWGRWEDVDHVRADDLPIRPDWLISCLGVEGFSKGPDGPIPFVDVKRSRMLFGGNEPKSGYRYLAREVVLDHRSGMPVTVEFYDPEGQGIFRGTLSDFREVFDPPRQDVVDSDDSASGGPRMAHRILLELPSGSRLELKLEDPTIPESHKEGMFVMPDPSEFDEELIVERTGVKRIQHRQIKEPD
jgi:hypothetical protein